jgi:hypothetical protein
MMEKQDRVRRIWQALLDAEGEGCIVVDVRKKDVADQKEEEKAS